MAIAVADIEDKVMTRDPIKRIVPWLGIRLSTIISM